MSTVEKNVSGTQGTPIGIADAVRAARDFLTAIHEAIQDEELLNIRLEEIEFDRDRGEWSVTLGYDRATTNPLANLGLGSTILTRVYKTITVDSLTGEPRGMKIRLP